MILLPDNAQRAKNSLIAFYILGATQIVSTVSTIFQYNLLQKILKGNYTADEAASNDLRQQIIAFFNAAMYIVCVVLFIMWFRRAYNNLNLSGREYTKFGEGWAAGAWFVPFLNLGRPYLIMKEIWEKTQQATENLISIKSNKIVGWWWVLWIIYNVGSYITLKLLSIGEEIDGLLKSTIAALVFNFFEMAALILLIIIIKNVAVFERNLQHSLLNEVDVDGEDKLNFIVNEH